MTPHAPSGSAARRPGRPTEPCASARPGAAAAGRIAAILLAAGLLTTACQSAAPRAGLSPADNRAASRSWTMLVDYDRRPVWVDAADLKGAPKAGIRRATVLSVVLPEADGSGPAGWIENVFEFQCDKGRSRIVSVHAADVDGGPLTPPPWRRPNKDFAMVTPHTPEVTLMNALCDGHVSGDGTVVTGGPADVVAFQAQLRKTRLGH